MIKRRNRSIAIFFVMVAAFLLIFGGLALGEGSPNGVGDWSHWTAGTGFILFTVLPAAGLCVLLDWVLFNKEN